MRETIEYDKIVGLLLIVCSTLLAITNLLGIIHISWWLTLLPVGLMLIPLVIAIALLGVVLLVSLPILVVVAILLLLVGAYIVVRVAAKFIQS
jgi:hypothetical protein